eukprot:TRINITY_DN5316_c0_g1_i1.p1 TRINITY_DN5316_c0_g1~~TRINITY_DN5316_c0_g1_i1.p1  ORF type:complete len:529 (-),score=110.78 TRINITY_DN5316_c0_g1_i1:15-1601(-)
MTAEEILKNLVPDSGKFERDFTLLKKIKGGQFFSVYLAQNKMDQQEYTVKKRIHEVTSLKEKKLMQEVTKMLQEVRIEASIINPYVLRYHHSWIELTTNVIAKSEPNPIDPDSLEGFSLDDLAMSKDAEVIPDQNHTLDMGKTDPVAVKNNISVLAPPSLDHKSTITLYIQLENIKQSLEEYVNCFEMSFDEEELAKRLRYASQIIQGLYAIHKKHNLVHRNISLKNIYIGTDGKMKIGDFGLAVKCKRLLPIAASPSITPQKYTKKAKIKNCAISPVSLVNTIPVSSEDGTPELLSPEQESGFEYDQRTDIYFLGVVLDLLFCPFEGAFAIECSVASETYESLLMIIKKMKSINPDLRPNIEMLLSFTFFTNEATEKFPLTPKGKGLTFLPKEKEVSACVSAKIGSEGKWKERHLKIEHSKIFLYNSLDSPKARKCYDMSECKIEILPYGKSPKKLGKSKFDLPLLPIPDTEKYPEEEKEDRENLKTIVIEHKVLQTLFLKINPTKLEHQLWFNSFTDSSIPKSSAN